MVLVLSILAPKLQATSPPELLELAIRNHLADLQSLREYAFEVQERNAELTLLGSERRSWGFTFDVVIANGIMYRTIVDTRGGSRRQIGEFPPVSMTCVTEFDPGIPLDEIPKLYQVATVREVFLDGRATWLLRLTPRRRTEWPRGVNPYVISMFVDERDQRIAKLECRRRRESLTFIFAKTHGTWLLQRTLVESASGSLLHRVRYRTEHTYTYRRFGVSTRIVQPPS